MATISTSPLNSKKGEKNKVAVSLIPRVTPKPHGLKTITSSSPLQFWRLTGLHSAVLTQGSLRQMLLDGGLGGGGVGSSEASLLLFLVTEASCQGMTDWIRG